MKEGPATIRKFLPALLLAALLGACETAAPAATPSRSSGGSSATPSTVAPTPVTASPEPPEPTELRVAFIQDVSPEGALRRLLQPFQAMELAFATAALRDGEAVALDLVPFDTGGDPTTAEEIADEVAADPAYVAAVAAPDLAGQGALADALADARVPLLSLSARDAVGDPPPGSWLRLVPPLTAQAEALAGTASSLRAARSGICAVEVPADGTRFSRATRRALPAEPVVTDVAGPGDAHQAGCGVVLWTGGSTGAAQLALALSEMDPGPVVVGGAALLDREFLELAGAAAEGWVAVCSCADVSTSLDLAGQRFVQGYQSEYGSPPGAYAVEAWDAAHLLIRGIREAGPTRQALVGWLSTAERFEGLGGTYALRHGELADPASAMRVYRLLGGRWTRVEPSSAGPR